MDVLQTAPSPTPTFKMHRKPTSNWTKGDYGHKHSTCVGPDSADLSRFIFCADEYKNIYTALTNRSHLNSFHSVINGSFSDLCAPYGVAAVPSPSHSKCMNSQKWCIQSRARGTIHFQFCHVNNGQDYICCQEMCRFMDVIYSAEWQETISGTSELQVDIQRLKNSQRHHIVAFSVSSGLTGTNVRWKWRKSISK